MALGDVIASPRDRNRHRWWADSPHRPTGPVAPDLAHARGRFDLRPRDLATAWIAGSHLAH